MSLVILADVRQPFDLIEVGGEQLTRDPLLKNGPLVLVFFRFAGCPACNIALPYYNLHLAPELATLRATLVGISPQVPERLVAIKKRHKLDFLIASDKDNALGRRFGILYTFDEPSKRSSIAGGAPIGEVTGTGTGDCQCRRRSSSMKAAMCALPMSAQTGWSAPNPERSSTRSASLPRAPPPDPNQRRLKQMRTK
ncbi:AhpC/TSA family protein (plasmid) [Rhizobium sullae]|uniref:AhpC/TSA family protein n=1 Tax=Rhizobium sullae TaxID=50338 RepID=A0ABY5XUC5_RHISU|nr:peroxiredoxin-like family protein [Rhizobium sullae]UWU18131.1 AhpC/TSA family protein [Rhizobium sullae]